jgi:ribosome maturation factor RimP
VPGIQQQQQVAGEEGVMREDSHRGSSRSARAPGRPGVGRDKWAPGSAGAGRARAGGQAGYAPARPAQGARPGPQVPAASAKLTSLIEPVLAAMEIDLEAVKVISAGRRVVLRIVVDADGGVSLDDIAEVSREVSARLDAKNAMGEAPYTLEVTSPGIDRPLTQPRHWRRAAGRLVLVTPLTGRDQDMQLDADGAPVAYKGRVITADQDRVTLDIDGERRAFSFDELGPGRVQVEFGRLDATDDADDDEDAEDSWPGEDVADGSSPDNTGGSGGSPRRNDEEEPDGY